MPKNVNLAFANLILVAVVVITFAFLGLFVIVLIGRYKGACMNCERLEKKIAKLEGKEEPETYAEGVIIPESSKSFSPAFRTDRPSRTNTMLADVEPRPVGDRIEMQNLRPPPTAYTAGSSDTSRPRTAETYNTASDGGRTDRNARN